MSSDALLAPRGPLYGRAARLLSLLAALALTALVLAYPVAFADLGHGWLTGLMWGIAAGYTHGVGYVPENRFIRFALGPWVGWPLSILAFLLVMMGS